MADLLEHPGALNPWWSGRDFDTGVRCSGKTAPLYRTICNLIDEQGVDPAIDYVIVEKGFSPYPRAPSRDRDLQECAADGPRRFHQRTILHRKRGYS